MALAKDINFLNGVTLVYHRVVSVNTITNVQNIIEVASYPSVEKREEEKGALISGEPTNVYIQTQYFNAPYDPEMTIDNSYGWLKDNINEFNGAKDA